MLPVTAQKLSNPKSLKGKSLTQEDCYFSSSILLSPQTSLSSSLALLHPPSLSLPPPNPPLVAFYILARCSPSLLCHIQQEALVIGSRTPCCSLGLVGFLEGWEGVREAGSARWVFMLMLLNSRWVMKGSLRDLIEVSVGQMRGSVFFHQPCTELAQGRSSGPQSDKQKISSQAREQGLGATQRTCC